MARKLFPFGENVIEVTESLWTWEGHTVIWLVSTSQMQMVLSDEPEATRFSSGENMELWPSRRLLMI